MTPGLLLAVCCCAVAAVASGCGGASQEPLPPGVHGSAPRADYAAGLAIVRADAELAKVLGGTSFSVLDHGTFEGRRSTPGGKPDLVGVVFRLQLAHPTSVDAPVPSVFGPWPPGSAHFDPAASSIEFRSRLTGTVVDLIVLVDLRSRAVVGISPGSQLQEASLTQLTAPSLLPPVDPTPE